MTATGFLRRVTLGTAVAVSLVALVAAWLAGTSAGVGVVAGGVLVVGNLWWLARVAASAARNHEARWALGAMLRLTVLGGACAVVLASGLAHPVAVVIGLTVLPCALIVQGLRVAREA
jgi:hypothetical protein